MVSKAIPPQFNVSQPAVASYDWTDIAEGTGIVTFYLIEVRDNTGDIFKLIPSQIEGSEQGANGWSSTSYVSFDTTPFNAPRVMKGWAFFSGEVNHTGTNGTITATLYHYDGTTETAIGTEATSSSKTGDWNFCLAFNVSRKHFKKGDMIRLKVKTSAAAIYLNLDPSKTTGVGTQPPRLSVPFEINV